MAAVAAAGSSAAAELEVAPAPCPRMNALVALRGNAMYVYGGLYEPGEALEVTLNDLWVIDLSKLDGWTAGIFTCWGEGSAAGSLQQSASTQSLHLRQQTDHSNFKNTMWLPTMSWLLH